MSRKTTAQQVATAQEKRKQADQELKLLLKKQREEERIKRDKRHTERGAIAEKIFDRKAELSDENFQKLLEDVYNVYNKQPRNTKRTNFTAMQTDDSVNSHEK